MKKTIIIFLIFLFLPGILYARNEDEPVIKMEEVVVTGTRYQQRLEKIPAHVSVITSKQIQEIGAQSVPDALRSMGGILVRDLSGNGNNQMVDMGGFGETADRHVAVMVNGRRVNPIDQSGIRWTTIPIENIERIEILHGSGSVLYGDNAVGGVINIITRDWEREIHLSSEVSRGNLDSRKGQASVSFGKERFGVYAGINKYKTDGYRERSESDRYNLYSKIRYDALDNVSVFFETSTGEASYELPGSLTEAQRDADREQSVNPSDQGKDKVSYFVYGMEADWGKRGFWNLRLSHREEDRSSDMASWFNYMDFDITTKGLTTQYILESPLAGSKNRLTMGADAYKTDYESWGGFFKGAKTNHFDHCRKTASLYAQDEFNITDSLLLNTGARYEGPDTDLNASVAGTLTRAEFDESEWAWNVGLAYSFRPQSKVYARIYRSYRYPVVDEYTNLFTGAVNTSLEQETSMGYEAGLRLSLADCLVFDLRGYRLDVDNEITWNNLTNQNENLDATRHIGGEIELRYNPLSYLSFYCNAGYTDARHTKGDYDGKQVPLIPEWKGNGGMELNLESGLKCRLQLNYIGERYFGNDYSNTQKEMDGYQTVDIYASYNYRFLEFFLNASNIFGEEYSDFGFYNSWSKTFNYYPMPEAVYFGGVRINF